MRIRTLNGKILFTFLGSLLVGIILMVSISTVASIGFTLQAANNVAENSLNEALKTQMDLVRQKASVVNESLNEFSTDISFLASYAEDLFNDRISVDPLPGFPLGYGIENDPEWIEPIGYNFSEKHHQKISLEVSGFYMANSTPNGVTTIDSIRNDPDLMSLVNQSSNLDFALKSVYESNPLLIWTYMGFSNGFHRTYPYKSLTHWPNLSITNVRSNQPVIGYNPSLRSWFYNVEKCECLQITGPFFDAAGTGAIISFGKPVFLTNGTLIGVIAFDLTIATMAQTIRNLQVLDSGYSYLIDENGIGLIHKDIDYLLLEDKPAGEIFDILDLEFNQSIDKTSFQPILHNMTTGLEGRDSFNKNGKNWVISYTPISSGNFSLAVVVPEEDILSTALEIQNQLINSLLTQLGQFLIFIILISSILFFTGKRISQRIVDPVRELTGAAELIANGNYTSNLRGKSKGAVEISVLYDTFSGLITALRFGNAEYYAGNMDRALSNYLDALVLFRSLNNKKGIGICYNNIGNIHRIRGDLKDANDAYLEAIEIGEDLLSKSTDENKHGLIIALASRYNNVGLLYTAIEQYEKAEEVLRKALDLDKQIDNARGFATRYGNLGQLYIKQSRFKEAKDVFDEALSIAEAFKSERAIIYALMNLGIYEKSRGNHDLAEKYLVDVAERAQNVDSRVLLGSLVNLRDIYVEIGNLDNIKKLEGQIERFTEENAEIKEITFILDYSGSMAGRRIRASVEGIIKIFTKQARDIDLVSLIIFHNNSETILEQTLKKDNEKMILQKINSLSQPNGTTAFYDALESGFRNFANNPSFNQRWMIVLTDGDDNSSKKATASSVAELAKKAVGVNLVIIGVGELKDKMALKQMCRQSNRGKFIDIKESGEVAEAISNAFEEISIMISEVEVEGFVPDD
ncbi:MAG: tetratricopeptide repeat protein [Candidatus Hodarchaeales archaeon]|jgi:tetratricopeptide (TPR) repeat protein